MINGYVVVIPDLGWILRSCRDFRVPIVNVDDRVIVACKEVGDFHPGNQAAALRTAVIFLNFVV